MSGIRLDESDVVDTVGAGDAFCGALAAALANGTDRQAALEAANRAGAEAVQWSGAQPYAVVSRPPIEGGSTLDHGHPHAASDPASLSRTSVSTRSASGSGPAPSAGPSSTAAASSSCGSRGVSSGPTPCPTRTSPASLVPAEGEAAAEQFGADRRRRPARPRSAHPVRCSHHSGHAPDDPHGRGRPAGGGLVPTTRTWPGTSCSTGMPFAQWYEEDEPVLGHPRDLFDRDRLPQVEPPRRHRHRRVTLADTTRATLLFETPLPTRYYVPREDVAMDLPGPTRTLSARTRARPPTGPPASATPCCPTSPGRTRSRATTLRRSLDSSPSTPRSSTHRRRAATPAADAVVVVTPLRRRGQPGRRRPASRASPPEPPLPRPVIFSCRRSRSASSVTPRLIVTRS